MSQLTYRANLTAAEFPFLSELQGRTIIVPSIDQNYSRQSSSPKNKDRDIGIPQIYYMHNVIATEAGVSSISYQSVALPPFDTDNTFQDIYPLRDPAENFAYFNNTSSGRNYILLNLGAGWLRTTDKAPAAGKIVTTAHVNGQTYIFFGGIGCFKYNFATNVLDAVTLTGLAPANILGICASSGYMIAWTVNTVFWSSIVDPTDFTPSLISGAGSQGVQEAKAAITICLPMNSGFVAYTKRNAVAHSYSGNSQFPFNAREIIGAGGLANANLAAYDGNSTNHLAYTTAGVQEISMKSAAPTFPQVTDFIAGAQFEDYDEITNTFIQLELPVPMHKKLTIVANRYVIMSYGVGELSHALVYDMAHARWGKLKIKHVDCFEYSYPSSDVVEAPRRSIGFVQADGTIIVCIMAYNTTGSYGTVLMGKYQLDRDHYLGLQEIHMESIKAGNTLNVKVLTSIDGFNTAVSLPTQAISISAYRRYNCRTTGLNHSIVVSGAFHLNSLILKFSDEGEVR